MTPVALSLKDQANLYPLDGSPKLLPFINERGGQIVMYKWAKKADCPLKGIIYCVHGLRSHIRFEYLRHKGSKRTPEEKIPEYKLGKNGKAFEGVTDWGIYDGSWVETMNKEGYDVFGIDLQGHGLSDLWENSPTNVEFFDDFVKDVIAGLSVINKECLLLDANEANQTDQANQTAQTNQTDKVDQMDKIDQTNQVNEANQGVKRIPVNMLGISMGGNVVVRFGELLGKHAENRHWYLPSDEPGAKEVPAVQTAPKEPNEPNKPNEPAKEKQVIVINGIIGLSSMLSLDKIGSRLINRILISVGRWLSKYSPHTLLGSLDRHPLYEWINKEGSMDPLIPSTKKLPARLVLQILQTVDRVQEDLEHFPSEIALLLIHSKFDSLCDPWGSEKTIEALESRLKRSKLVMLSDPKLWHFLTIESGNEQVLEAVFDFVK